MFSTALDCTVLVPESLPANGENRVYVKTQESELLKNKVEQGQEMECSPQQYLRLGFCAGGETRGLRKRCCKEGDSGVRCPS